MKTLLFFLTFLLSGFSIAQHELPDTTEIVAFPEVEAEFPGGGPALMKYIHENLRYPQEYGNIDFDGKIYLSFCVNTDGSLSDIKVERGLDTKLNEMGIKLIEEMPKWKPAENGGKPVKMRVRIPIIICLK